MRILSYGEGGLPVCRIAPISGNLNYSWRYAKLVDTGSSTDVCFVGAEGTPRKEDREFLRKKGLVRVGKDEHGLRLAVHAISLYEETGCSPTLKESVAAAAVAIILEAQKAEREVLEVFAREAAKNKWSPAREVCVRVEMFNQLGDFAKARAEARRETEVKHAAQEKQRELLEANRARQGELFALERGKS